MPRDGKEHDAVWCMHFVSSFFFEAMEKLELWLSFFFFQFKGRIRWSVSASFRHVFFWCSLHLYSLSLLHFFLVSVFFPHRALFVLGTNYSQEGENRVNNEKSPPWLVHGLQTMKFRFINFSNKSNFSIVSVSQS